MTYNPFAYAHMCCDEHVQIGHDDSDHEQCPLCRAIGTIRHLIDDKDTTYSVRVMRARDFLASVGIVPEGRS